MRDPRNAAAPGVGTEGGANNKAGGPDLIVSTTVRLRVDISRLPSANGYLTREGSHRARVLLDELRAAPRGVRAVLYVGRVRPELVGDVHVWADLIDRLNLEVEAETATVAADWHGFLTAQAVMA